MQGCKGLRNFYTDTFIELELCCLWHGALLAGSGALNNHSFFSASFTSFIAVISLALLDRIYHKLQKSPLEWEIFDYFKVGAWPKCEREEEVYVVSLTALCQLWYSFSDLWLCVHSVCPLWQISYLSGQFFGQSLWGDFNVKSICVFHEMTKLNKCHQEMTKTVLFSLVTNGVQVRRMQNFFWKQQQSIPHSLFKARRGKTKSVSISSGALWREILAFLITSIQWVYLEI